MLNDCMTHPKGVGINSDSAFEVDGMIWHGDAWPFMSPGIPLILSKECFTNQYTIPYPTPLIQILVLQS